MREMIQTVWIRNGSEHIDDGTHTRCGIAIDDNQDYRKPEPRVMPPNKFGPGSVCHYCWEGAPLPSLTTTGAGTLAGRQRRSERDNERG